MLVLLAACCPTFEETRVIGSAAEREVLQEALDTFAGWTLREGVCVASIEASAVTKDDAAGTFDGTHIQVATDQISEEVVLHELCHARDADHEVGGTRVTRHTLYRVSGLERIASVAVAGTSIVLLHEVTSADGTQTTATVERVDPTTAMVTDTWRSPRGWTRTGGG